ncbi:hypothetical protein AGOR_G00163160 [Albula goreensis]|uniref:Uncharacterized protein n=1 Tax=Albula goreensis TaxID=1534307 RepID=A0A8T3CZ23_9TELE|nr:hypothetical protein AGOR_G00163160 [Albula goreensis]
MKRFPWIGLDHSEKQEVMKSSGWSRSLDPGAVLPASLPDFSQRGSLSYGGALFSFYLPMQEEIQNHKQHSRIWNPVVPSTIGKSAWTNRIVSESAKTAISTGGREPRPSGEGLANQKWWDREDGQETQGVTLAKAARKERAPPGLAVPKPVYAHAPLCFGCLCTPGPTYSMERGSQMLQYGPRTLPVQPGSHAPLKEISLEGCYVPRLPPASLLPAITDPDCSSPSFRSPSHKQCHNKCWRIPSKMCQDVSLQGTLEGTHWAALPHPRLPRMHQGWSPEPKHVTMPHLPIFCYPQEAVETDSAVADKEKHNSQNPLGQQPVDLTSFSSNAISSTEGHPFHTNFDHLSYRSHGVNLSVGQKRSFSEGPGAPGSSLGPAWSLDHPAWRMHMLSSPRMLCEPSKTRRAFTPVQPRARYQTLRCMPIQNPAFKTPSDHACGVRLPSPKRVAPNFTLDHRPSVRYVDHLYHPHKQTIATTNHEVDGSHKPIAVESPSSRKLTDSINLDEVADQQQGKRESSQSLAGDRPRPSPFPLKPVANNVFSSDLYEGYFQMTGVLPPRNAGGVGGTGTDLFSRERCIEWDSNSEESGCQAGCSQPPQNRDTVAAPERLATVREVVALPQVSDREMKLEEFEKKTKVWRRRSREMGMKMVEGGGDNETGCSPHSSNSVLDLSVRKSRSGFEGPLCNPGTSPSSHASWRPETRAGTPDSNGQGLDNNRVPKSINPPSTVTPTPKPGPLPLTWPETPCSALSSESIVLGGAHIQSPVQRASPGSGESSLVERSPTPDLPRQARHQLLELHLGLCKLVCCAAEHAPEQQLRDWLAESFPLAGKSCESMQDESVPITEKQHASAPLKRKEHEPGSTTGEPCGAGAREAWLRYGGVASVLAQVTYLLAQHLAARDWPFPHVLRAGAVFVPVLLVKDTLFPWVPGPLLDRVLQEHRAELRPATLSEERLLARLHMGACHSKLRKLLSLKHLPHLYPDLLHLLFCTYASRRLGVELNTPTKRKRAEPSGSTEGPDSGAHSQSSTQTPDLQRGSKDSKTQTPAVSLRRTGSGKGGKRRGTLEPGEGQPQGDSSGSGNNLENQEGMVSSVEGGERKCVSLDESGDQLEKEEEEEGLMRGNREGMTETESLIGLGASWKLLSETSEADMLIPEAPLNPGQPSNAQPAPRSPHDMILKLRKFLVNNPPPRGANSERQGEAGDAQGNTSRIPQRTRRRFGVEGFPMPLQLPPGGRPEKLSLGMRLRSSVLQARHSACLQGYRKHLQERSLRSVTRATRLAPRDVPDRYPQLVGKTICHLYEEKDKSEVWYRGVVLRVHKENPDPLKTVFEVRYDREPEWQYYLELLVDFERGWLKVEED